MGIFDEFIYKNGEIVDNRWVKWYHFGVPDKEGEEWMIHPLGTIICTTPLGG